MLRTDGTDGGPAYPTGDPTHGGDWGMSLRDAAAMAALPQAVEDYDRRTRAVMDTKVNVLPWACEATGTREEIIARQAYRYADAMIKARDE